MLVTVLLILANCAAQMAGMPYGNYGLVPAHPSFTAMVTSMFVHDPSTFGHLAGNMAFLLLSGVVVERELGHLRFLALYLAAGIGGAIMHILVNPASTDVLVGASGAISGLFAVVAVLRPRLFGFVAIFVALNVWRAFTGTDGGVSFGAHLGGFAVGAMFVVVTRVSGRLEAAA